MKKQCDFHIHLDNFEAKEAYHLGEEVTGQITIRAKETFQAQEVGFRLIAENKVGQFTRGKKILYSETLAKNIGLSLDKELKYDVGFINDEIESYSSRRMNIQFRVEVFILVDQLNKFNNYISESLRIEFVAKDRKFSVVSKTIQLQMEEILVLLGLLILVPLFIYFSPVVNLVLYLLATLGFAVLLVTLNHFFRIKYLGEIFAFFQNKEDDHFLLTLKNSRNWKHLKKLSVHYQIFESYSTAGDSDGGSIQRNIIFRSEKKSISNLMNQVQIEFEFPQNMPPTTMLHPDGIYWKIVVEAESDVGKIFIYKNNYEVKKVSF